MEREKIEGINSKKELNFEGLINTIEGIIKEFTFQAKKAVNISLTLRNWFIGAYIHEYELNGNDRAKYGEELIEKVSTVLQEKEMSRCEPRELRRY